LHSTGFWIPHADLMLFKDARQRPRYQYGAHHQNREVPYVGLAEPVELIPAGTWVRVSLAQWWRPSDSPGVEERCYLQLSGWFFR
jgi:hypothetical protein